MKANVILHTSEALKKSTQNHLLLQQAFCIVSSKQGFKCYLLEINTVTSAAKVSLLKNDPLLH